MQQKYFFFLVFLMVAVCAKSQDQVRYIDRYKDIAIREMERAGIPASIKLAQGILESGAGSSRLARKANNHFGIKCHNDWDGKGYYLEDDDYDDRGKLIKSCFRVYKNPESSYIAHSEFLRDPNKRFRYGRLFLLDPTDYRSWAYGLKQAGYATSPTYAEKLIQIIERYQLFRFDSEAYFIDLPDDDRYLMADVRSNNHVKFVLAEGNENIADIALRTDVKAKCLVKFNEAIKNKSDQPAAESRIYIQRKRCGYRGKQKWHYVQEGETMYGISQLYGIKLKRLYKRNRLEEGQQPAIGEKVKIRGWKVSRANRPTLRSERYQPPEESLPSEIISVDPDDEGDEEFSDFFEPDFEENDDEFTPPTEPPFEPDPPVVTPPVTDPPVTTQPDPPVTTNPTPGLEPIYHIVTQGDTLYNIGRRNGISVDRIKRLNNLNSDIISIGQRLRIQ